ncbi:histidine phosphatase family protein [Marispirochaeta sp.]|uniref:histidine phosphatase family protein n=1 Tax=Marispirochaeta sp. TaxID=2038653 RepID=UPI0029C99DC7|nr:histidine phosphatase family protein [Marispirochaeta sp.]
MTELFILRHGETLWNTEQRFQGQADSPLTGEGQMQAHSLARRVAAVRPSVIYTSDLGRAYSTARIIADECGFIPQPDIRLRERNVGILTGLTFDTIRGDHAGIWERYFEADYVIPEGESLNQLLERGQSFLDHVAENHPYQRVAAVSHGAMISTMLRHVLHIPHHAPRNFSLYNCALNMLEYLQGAWRLRVLGDTAHLAAKSGILDEVQ